MDKLAATEKRVLASPDQQLSLVLLGHAISAPGPSRMGSHGDTTFLGHGHFGHFIAYHPVYERACVRTRIQAQMEPSVRSVRSKQGTTNWAHCSSCSGCKYRSPNVRPAARARPTIISSK